jgi:DNA (cytosine-5)-methyltransferase 1
MGVPVIDLFAGPGGLGEGFSAVRDQNGHRVFDIRVSIEKDAVAHRTLTLRALFRALSEHGIPDTYYDYLRGDIDRATLMSDRVVASVQQAAGQEAHCLELGQAPESQIDDLIRTGISGSDDWVLIGGPPCQAYSIAGRSRRKNVDPSFENDPKHFLYREYLRIIRVFQPAVFVMENVKGMLSSTHDGKRIFERILGDLSEPKPGVRYDIRSFTTASRPTGLNPEEFLIRAEDFSIPQMRHRVILLGIRSDLASRSHELLIRNPAHVTVRNVLSDLPALRSKLSRQPDSHETWLKVLGGAKSTLSGWHWDAKKHVELHMEEAVHMAQHVNRTGGQFMTKDLPLSPDLPENLAQWFHDDRLAGICQHETRSHMASDLHRYLFAACFARQHQYAPKLNTFPRKLLPAHGNVGDENMPFDDRFRVQLADLPSTTIVSHIAKDGHYYIHPDPAQCRSLTVREAARLQTFPDNYFFEGNRTQQYHQVGNAVPPFLAKQLGESVARFLRKSVNNAHHAEAADNGINLES